MLKGLASEDQQRFDEELNDARNHCHRAMYEASEAGISYLFELLKTFEIDYKDVPVAETVPDYIDTRLVGMTVAKKLSEGRLNRTSPEEQARNYMDMFRDFKNGVDKLESSRSELNKVKCKQAREDRRFIIRVVFWSATALIGIAGILLQVG